jgi:hypothetical protein
MEAAPQSLKKPEINIGRWLFNPFYYLAGGRSLVIGAVLVLAAGLAAFAGGARFDGVLDFHFIGASQPAFGICLLEGTCSWIIMGALLLVGGKIISASRIRALDVFGTQALARWPGVISAALAFLPGVRGFAKELQATSYSRIGEVFSAHLAKGLTFGLSVTVSLLMLIWMVFLMYRAFAVSCNVRGGKAAGVFIVAVFLGEIISKLLLVYANKYLPFL